MVSSAKVMSLAASKPKAVTADTDFDGDLALLAAYSQFFAVSRDLDATLETALAGIMAGTGAEAGALLLASQGEGDLVCRIAAGRHRQRGVRLAADDDRLVVVQTYAVEEPAADDGVKSSTLALNTAVGRIFARFLDDAARSEMAHNPAAQ